MEQLYLWKESKPEAQPSNDGAALVQIQGPIVAPDELDELVCPESVKHDVEGLEHVVGGPPIAIPLETAVAAGVFGCTTDGPFALDEEEVETLTGEHANEMIVLLSDWQAVEHAQRFGYDAATRRVPSTPEQRDSLSARLDKEIKRLSQAYADAVAAYAEGFGDTAAAALDQWVRKTVADGDPQREPYPLSHPWHYYHAGDNAQPIPLESIEADPEAGRWLEQRLPKNKAKRLQVLREMLDKERASLAADRERYKQIVERGADALSRFDREIAHTSDAMAVATSLALKYTHVSQGLARVQWLEHQLGHIAQDAPKASL